MKVKIDATSSYFEKAKIIEVSSIDEAIKILQSDKKLVESVIDKRNSELYNSPILNKPNEFVINTNKHDNYDVNIEIYDAYRE